MRDKQIKTAAIVVESPIGKLLLSSADGMLTGLFMEKQLYGPKWSPDASCKDATLRETARQLAAYFAGELKQFDLPLKFNGTEFQRAVWQALCDIPLGETISYGELARRVDAPKAVRAVGAAVGRNPISIIAPCHRVVGSDGSLTGFGGGLPRKRWLLAHEGVGLTAADRVRASAADALSFAD